MDRQTLRDWAHHFNAQGTDGLKDIRWKGHPPRLALKQLVALAKIVETGPDRWTLTNDVRGMDVVGERLGTGGRQIWKSRRRSKIPITSVHAT